jgi:hypothetical protein
MIARRVGETPPVRPPPARFARNIERYAERRHCSRSGGFLALSSTLNIQHPSGWLRLRRWWSAREARRLAAEQRNALRSVVSPISTPLDVISAVRSVIWTVLSVIWTMLSTIWRMLSVVWTLLSVVYTLLGG